MKFFSKAPTTDEFLEVISKIQDPIIFLGLAKVLGISIFDEETNEAIPFELILKDMVTTFELSSKKFKRELIELTEAGGGADGTGAEDTEKEISDKEVQ